MPITSKPRKVLVFAKFFHEGDSFTVPNAGTCGQEAKPGIADEGWLELQWMANVEGGKATTYIVQRRLRSEVNWIEVASTYERKITLQSQPRGAELEYSVIATNKIGRGPISNTVLVVL